MAPIVIIIIIYHLACADLWLWCIYIQVEDFGSCIVPSSLFLGLKCGEVPLFCLWVCLPFLPKCSFLVRLLLKSKGGRKPKL